MKKIILISTGVITILIVVGVWTYLLMNGRPDGADDVFAQLGFGNDGVEQPMNTNQNSGDINEEVYQIDNTPLKLKQLTIRPVAGASFTENGMRYVEQGTGHVYELNLVAGTETLISGTTITQTIDAIFSNDGIFVAVTSIESGVSETLVGQVVNGELVGDLLLENASNISFDEDNNLLYSLFNSSGSIGYRYDLDTGEKTTLFENPLTDIVVLWGEPLYVYTTPSTGVVGYIYSVEGSAFDYVTLGRLGLSSYKTDSSLLVSSVEEGYAEIINLETDSARVNTRPIMPEKCVADTFGGVMVYCASPTNFSAQSYPDDWYMGLISYSDTLFGTNVNTGETSVVLELKEETGREIDIYKIGIRDDGLHLWFVNKNDNTLWLYDRTVR